MITRTFTLTLAALTLAAFAAFAAFGSGARAETAADLFSGFQSKSTDPVQVDAATLEVYEESGQRVSVFSGGVTVTRGKTLMKADNIKLFSSVDAKSADAFTRIEAKGSIFVESEGQRLTGDSATVNMKDNTIVVSGNVVVSEGANIISGSRLVVNLATGRARMEQAPGQQIRGVFSPGTGTFKKP